MFKSMFAKLFNMFTKKELVNHPKHYNSHPSGIEIIDIVEHMDFNLGNAFKYISRCGMKDDSIQEMKKSIWYIKREIKRIENWQNIEMKYPCNKENSTQCYDIFVKFMSHEPDGWKKQVYELIYRVPNALLIESITPLLNNSIFIIENEINLRESEK